MERYVSEKYKTTVLPAIRAGKTGDPEALAAGGAYATGEIVFADNPTAADTITLAGIVVEFTSSASDATAAGTAGDPILVNIKGSLALTLDELIAVCNNASMPAAAKVATYTEDGVDTFTITHDTMGSAGNAFTLAASADTPSAATLASGADVVALSVETEPSKISVTQAVDQYFTLADGDEAQRKIIYAHVKSGAGNAIITPANFHDGTTITFDADSEYIALMFLDGSWRQIATNATVA